MNLEDAARNGFAMAIIDVNKSIRASCKRLLIKRREMSWSLLQLDIRQKKGYVAVGVTKGMSEREGWVVDVGDGGISWVAALAQHT